MTNRYTARARTDRKSTRLNSSHLVISYAVFCLKKHSLLQGEEVGLWRGARPPAPTEHGHSPASGEARRCGASVPYPRTNRERAFALQCFFFNDRAPPEISPYPPLFR